jgi:predicted ATPase with chaperone activity
LDRLPDAAVKAPRDRVSTVPTNSGFKFPLCRSTINPAPADVKTARAFVFQGLLSVRKMES